MLRKSGSDFKHNKGKENITVIQDVTAVEQNGGKHLKVVE